MEKPFFNLMATAGTFRTWTPMRVAATCAAMGASLDIGAVTDPAEAETRLEAGTRSSFRSGLGPAAGSSRRGPTRIGNGINVYIYRRPPREPARARPDARSYRRSRAEPDSRTLDLGDNDLSGDFPAVIGSMAELETRRASGNRETEGRLPIWLT